ncbi:MAG: thioredoxin domain-containing protein [Ramlibacter sp.]
MKLLKFAGAVLAAAMLLAGCKDATTPAAPAAAPAARTPVTTAAIEAEAKGFIVGTPMATRTVYVFFDPQCPHCAVLWQQAKPLKNQAKFVWIPVAFSGATGMAQGATILAAPDPVAKMEENEASILAKTGGITAASGVDAQQEQVKKNTELLTRMGFESVPSIVALHAQTGQLVTAEGSMPTAELAARLGLQAPAQ